MKKSPEIWVQEIHENAVAHGWWIDDRDFGEICALIHSELSEALEEYRNARPTVYYHCGKSDHVCDPEACAAINRDPIFAEEPCDRRNSKPEGIAVELADVVIRIFDYFGRADIVPKRNIFDPVEYLRGMIDLKGLELHDALRSAGYTAAEAAVEHDDYKSFGDFIANCHADISTAYDAGTPEGIAIYLQTSVARIAEWLRENGIDLETVIEAKHKYNKSRPYRHGGKKI